MTCPPYPQANVMTLKNKQKSLPYDFVFMTIFTITGQIKLNAVFQTFILFFEFTLLKAPRPYQDGNNLEP